MQVDITGQKFGCLKAIKFSKRIGNRYIWWFKCDCGNKIEVPKGHIMNGHTKSCGCIRSNNLSVRNIVHGFSKDKEYTKFYRKWKKMRSRCNCKTDPNFSDYGERGIKCLWVNFLDFYNDMYKSYEIHVKEFGEWQTTIDRIDVNGNYCKENCRWATWGEQAKNKRPYKSSKPYLLSINKLKIHDKKILCESNV